jgi:hypothetical protein
MSIMIELPLPSTGTISAALRRTTEQLAHELHRSSASPPEWREYEWRIAQAASAIHGIAPILATRLAWRGPDRWRDFLEQQHEHTRRRHRGITDMLARLDAGARSRGIAIAALKGAALHSLGIYAPGERPMSDIDVLVHPDARHEAVRLIESFDYVFSHETWKHVVFEPRGSRAQPSIGEHCDNPIKIELHMAIAEMFPIERCDVSELVLPNAETPGLSFYRTNGALMAHLLLHAAGAMAMHSLRAIHLNDLACLARAMTRSDWDEVTALAQSDKFWWCLPVLTVARRYFPDSIPKYVIEDAERVCTWPLRAACIRRSLTDVSLSDLRIRAFPGIEWSRSPLTASRYIRSRLWPTRETRALRAQYGKFQSLGADSPWVRSSQLARMRRWIAGRPLRVETMASVRSAFTS